MAAGPIQRFVTVGPVGGKGVTGQAGPGTQTVLARIKSIGLIRESEGDAVDGGWGDAGGTGHRHIRVNDTGR